MFQLQTQTQTQTQKHKCKRASTDIRPTQRSVASNMLSPAAHTETLDIILFFTFKNIQCSGKPNTSSGSIGNSSVTQFVNVAEAGDIVEVVETVEL